MAYFEVEGISLAFGGVQALATLDFRVDRGEVYAIIGPNGAGKTSILNVVTRVFRPDAGRVRFDGEDITSVARHRVVELGIARTYQNIELFDQATVQENLLVGRHRFRGPGLLAQMLNTPAVVRAEGAHRAAIERVIDLLDLAPYRRSPVASLPYGVRKMVELGRALASEPRLLLLDEPASGLNPEETRDLAFWIEDIVAELGVTVIMVEHDMSLVAGVADRVLVMNHGAMLAEGTVEAVRSNPEVARAYLGARAAGLLAGGRG